jgi:hypothetical protein
LHASAGYSAICLSDCASDRGALAMSARARLPDRRHRRAEGGGVMSVTKDPWNPPYRCPCGSSEDDDQWTCVHVSEPADPPVWMHVGCLVKFARGELESVQTDECELFRSWYRARKEGPKAK